MESARVGLLEDEVSTSPRESSELVRRIGARGVVMIGFFWVTGGFFGNEALVQLAPAGVVMSMLVAMPFLFCIPISLIMAELSAMLPRSGGQAVFVEAACGRRVGLQNACWILLTVLADASIYPQLAGDYAERWCGSMSWIPCAIKVTMVAATARAHLGGTAATERTSAMTSVLVLGPCVAFIGLGLPRLKASVLAGGFRGAAAETDPAMLLSWVLWNFSGWSSFGVIAGEVRYPVAKTLLRGIACLLPIVLALQALPVLISLSISPDRDLYEAGYFDHIARRLGGPALSACFAVGAQFSNLGYHSSQMISAQRTLYFIVEEHWGPASQPTTTLDVQERATWRRYLFAAPEDGVRRIYVLACGAASLALVFVPYKALLQVEIALYCISKTLFLFSFVVLRWSRPNAPRPFVVPGGALGTVLAVLAPLVVVGANLVFTFFGEWIKAAHAATDDDAPFPGFRLVLCVGLMAAVAGATAVAARAHPAKAGAPATAA